MKIKLVKKKVTSLILSLIYIIFPVVSATNIFALFLNINKIAMFFSFELIGKGIGL